MISIILLFLTSVQFFLNVKPKNVILDLFKAIFFFLRNNKILMWEKLTARTLKK